LLSTRTKPIPLSTEHLNTLTPDPVHPRSRLLYAGMILLVMASGILLRSRFVSLPPFPTKYGGDALWALLVFFGFGFIFPRLRVTKLACISLGFAWIIEFSQLYHAPWIDGIRAMRVGHLILGSTFNWPDLPAYALGIALGIGFEACRLRHDRTRT
jgi:Protein of unknown function (DUF2809)